MIEDDPHDLARFLVAQDDANHEGISTFDQAMHEVRAGEKVSHWMWFVYPQLRALGRSDTARHFGISGIEEARAFWEHPVLGIRLNDAVRATFASGKREAIAIFGDVDAVKLRSCLTLFLAVAPDNANLRAALDYFYDGAPDPVTITSLGT
jgi:uncharacterized protein (DUF1810 family)